jgi:hypothetical protein
VPLYRPDHAAEVAPEDAVVVVHRFLERCRAWADEREIPRRLDRVRDTLDLDEASKLQAWIAWKRFTEHALRELERGELDRWFVPGDDDRG